MTRDYRTAAAFKQALEQRLRTASTSGVDFARRRQLVVFDRFLARIALELGDAVTLKERSVARIAAVVGAIAVQLRRATPLVLAGHHERDIDLLLAIRPVHGAALGDELVLAELHPEAR